jgi:hypothetical protein
MRREVQSGDVRRQYLGQGGFHDVAFRLRGSVTWIAFGNIRPT